MQDSEAADDDEGGHEHNQVSDGVVNSLNNV